jgi:exodeoxyribonuclease VII small subunit
VNEPSNNGPSLESLRSLASQGSFEETLSALESVVSRLEQGQLAIADAVAWYETGLALSRHCEELLREAELRVSSLETTTDGRDADATLGDDKGR